MKKEWISVKDKLPEDGTHVLAHNGFPYMIYIAKIIDGYWYDDHGENCLPKYWMPLPKPPES